MEIIDDHNQLIEDKLTIEISHWYKLTDHLVSEIESQSKNYGIHIRKRSDATRASTGLLTQRSYPTHISNERQPGRSPGHFQILSPTGGLDSLDENLTCQNEPIIGDPMMGQSQIIIKTNHIDGMIDVNNISRHSIIYPDKDKATLRLTEYVLNKIVKLDPTNLVKGDHLVNLKRYMSEKRETNVMKVHQSKKRRNSGKLDMSNFFSNNKLVTNFEILEVLGNGAFGTVFKAEHKLEENLYAIKVIRVDKGQFNNALINSTIREILVMSRLKHRNIINYLSCWFEDGDRFDVNDFIDEAASEEGSSSDSEIGESEPDSPSSVDYVPWGSMANADPKKDLARSNFRRKMERTRNMAKDKDCTLGG